MPGMLLQRALKSEYKKIKERNYTSPSFVEFVHQRKYYSGKDRNNNTHRTTQFDSSALCSRLIHHGVVAHQIRTSQTKQRKTACSEATSAKRVL